MNAPEPYRQFLESKVKLASQDGFHVDIGDINPALKPHVRVAVQWALAGGRRAFFARFGMQKTTWHLEVMRQVLKRFGEPVLIVMPLGARLSFFSDAERYFTGEYAIRLNFVQSDAEIDAGAINLTNTETVREGKLDPTRFRGLSFDEGDILRNLSSKTFWEFARHWTQIPYSFVATATPDPQDYTELLAYASFLQVMDIGQARTRFFKRNSEKADELTLHAHKEQEFWLWVASWALFLHRPSDLGPEFSDEGYDLPPLDIRWHEVPSNHANAGREENGQGRLLKNAALGIKEASAEKRESMSARIERAVSIIREAQDEQQGIQSGLSRGEPEAAECAVPGAVPREPGEGRSREAESLHGGVQQEEPAQAIAGRKRAAECGTQGAVLSGPELSGEGESGAPRSEQATADGQAGNPAEIGVRPDARGLRRHARGSKRRMRHLRRSDGNVATGQEPEAFGGSLPSNGEGSRDPLPQLQSRDRSIQGQSGADTEGPSIFGQQWVIWCDLNAEQSAIERALDDCGISRASVHGSLDLERREELINDWWQRRASALLSKPVMLGAGLNLQQCNRSIFAGIGFKFKDFIQAVHRIYRFGQAGVVRIDIIFTEAERPIVAKLKERWQRYDAQAARMSALMREYGLARTSLGLALTRSMGAVRAEEAGETFRIVNNDCVEEGRHLATDSVDLIVSSLPFSTQYEYTPSYNDFGHTDDDEHFFAQMDFLTPELLRTLKPGRVCAIHCKDRIVEGSRSGYGFQTVSPFGDRVKAHFMRHGFAYLGTKTIVTDVVRENAQSYRLGWTEQCKDGSRMGFGLPEYLHVFRKPQTDRGRGYADTPVVKSKADYSVGRWQLDAAGFGRSSGDRLLSPAELAQLPPKGIFARYREHSVSSVYDYEHHVACQDALQAAGKLFPDFAIAPAQSWHPDVWTDVVRMRTLNTIAAQKSREKHLCPLPFDIVDRAINQYSMPGETVLDPFAGIGTVPYRAILLKRRGLGIELSPDYFRDAVRYCREAEAQISIPSLFDLIEAENSNSDEGGEAPATAERPAGTSDHLAEPLGAVTLASPVRASNRGNASGEHGRKEAGVAPGSSELSEPIDLPAFLGMTDPFTRMGHTENEAVVGKRGGTSGAVLGARSSDDPDLHADGRAPASFEYPEMPECLRRKPKAAA